MSLVTQVSNLATRIGTEIKSVRSSIGSLSSLATTDKSSIVAAINEVSTTAGATIDDVTASTTSVYSSSKTDSQISTAVSGKLDSSSYTASDVLSKLLTVDGAGSGLDADTLDGISSAGFAAAAHDHASTYQPLDADLTAIAGLAGTVGILKKTAANTWSLDTTSFASTSYVDTAVSGLVDAAPGALDTLNELAAALGDDANFATTTSTALGYRLRFDAAQTLDATQKAQGIANLGAISSTDVGDISTNFVTVFEAALV